MNDNWLRDLEKRLEGTTLSITYELKIYYSAHIELLNLMDETMRVCEGTNRIKACLQGAYRKAIKECLERREYKALVLEVANDECTLEYASNMLTVIQSFWKNNGTKSFGNLFFEELEKDKTNLERYGIKLLNLGK